MKHQVHILIAVFVAAVIGSYGCTDLKDGLPPSVTPGVQVHLPSWVDTASSNFHGTFVNAAHGDVQSCLVCHGQDYNGGSSNVSCVACHQRTGGTIHGRGWITPSSANFHGKAIAAANWDMRPCQVCHGVVYAGGKVPSSCRTCHTGGAGPENCSTCHGSAANPAPPNDVSGNTATTARGVGAHQRHLVGGGATSNYTLACANCHIVPATIYTPGHVDTHGPAEVILAGGGLVTFNHGNGVPPVYSSDSLKCSNTYCHGNWSVSKALSPYPDWYTANTMSGGNRPVRWNGGATEGACGTCHGLPPVGHFNSASIQRCGNCHIGIVGSDGRTIIDKSRHMNGMVDVFFDPSRSF